MKTISDFLKPPKRQTIMQTMINSAYLTPKPIPVYKPPKPKKEQNNIKTVTVKPNFISYDFKPLSKPGLLQGSQSVVSNQYVPAQLHVIPQQPNKIPVIQHVHTHTHIYHNSNNEKTSLYEKPNIPNKNPVKVITQIPGPIPNPPKPPVPANTHSLHNQNSVPQNKGFPNFGVILNENGVVLNGANQITKNKIPNKTKLFKEIYYKPNPIKDFINPSVLDTLYDTDCECMSPHLCPIDNVITRRRSPDILNKIHPRSKESNILSNSSSDFNENNNNPAILLSISDNEEKSDTLGHVVFDTDPKVTERNSEKTTFSVIQSSRRRKRSDFEKLDYIEDQVVSRFCKYRYPFKSLANQREFL